MKNYPVADVPSGAYIYTTQDALQVKLNALILTTNIYPGDVLLTTDPRFAAAGTFAAGSLTAINPANLTSGDELFSLTYSNQSDGGQNFIVAGDRIDIIVTECGPIWNAPNCATQTTYRDMLVCT